MNRVYFAIIMFCLAPFQAYASSATGSASVTIHQSAAMHETKALDFGTIIPRGADVITITPSGTVSAQNGSNVIGGGLSAAEFSSVGTPDASVTLSFENGTLKSDTNTAEMIISNFTHDLGNMPAFDRMGRLNISIGSDLNIPDNASVGAYTGNYAVSVNYQ